MRAALDGLTQAEFGALIGKSESTIQRWEKGRGQPDHFALGAYAESVGFARTYFIDDQALIPTASEHAGWRRAHEEALRKARAKAQAEAAEKAARKAAKASAGRASA